MFWLSSLLPSARTLQQLQLISIFNQLLTSSSFNVFVIFFENKTIDTLSAITESIIHNPNDHDIVLVNVDFINRLDVQKLKPCYSRAVNLDIFDNHDDPKHGYLRWNRDLMNVHPKWIRIYQPHTTYARFLNYFRHSTIFQIRSDGVQVISYNYNVSFSPNWRRDNGHLFEEMFVDWTVNLHGRRLYMSSDMDVPNLFHAKAIMENGVEHAGLGGIYAYVGQTIGDHLNATFLFGMPQFLPIRRINQYPYYNALKRRTYQTHFVVPHARRENVNYDFYDEYMELGYPMFPHKQESFVVLVPNERRSSAKLWHVFATSPIFTVWCFAITIFSLVRCLLRFCTRSDSKRIPAEQITLDTCGLSFGWAITSKTVLPRPERILIVFISLFAMLSGIFCSGMLLQQFTFNTIVPTINSFKDLQLMRMMTIMIPLGLYFNQDIWNPNHTFVHTQLNVIYGEILNRNTRCSYVLPESVADVLMAEDHMFDMDGRPVFHKISERIYSKHMSLYTTQASLQPSLHILMQRLVVHGQIHHFEEKCKLALRLRGHKTDDSKHSDSTSVTIDQLFFMIIVCWAGQGAGVLLFVAELVHFHRDRLRQVWRFKRRV